jgi:hypothetical protein
MTTKRQATAPETSAVPAVRETATSLQESVPDFLKDKTTARGTENIDAQHMVMPRIAICQSNTPQRKRQNPAFIEGLEEGHFFNTLTKRNYRDDIRFIPLFFYVSRIMFKPIEQGGGLMCQAPDGVSCQLNNGGRCLHNAWGPNGEPPDCTEFYNFPALILLDDGPAEFGVLSLKSTGIKAAKELNSMIRFRKKDAFAGIYRAQTVPDRKQDQDFFNITISNSGWVTPEQYSFAESQYEAIFPAVKRGEATLDVEGLAGEISQSDQQFAARDAEGADL